LWWFSGPIVGGHKDGDWIELQIYGKDKMKRNMWHVVIGLIFEWRMMHIWQYVGG